MGPPMGVAALAGHPLAQPVSVPWYKLLLLAAIFHVLWAEGPWALESEHRVAPSHQPPYCCCTMGASDNCKAKKKKPQLWHAMACPHGNVDVPQCRFCCQLQMETVPRRRGGPDVLQRRLDFSLAQNLSGCRSRL